MVQQPRPGAQQARPTEEQVRRFVSKLEAFAADLNDMEREMLRVALGVGQPAAGSADVRGYLSGLA